MSKPKAFKLQLDNNVTVVFTLEVTDDGQPDQERLDEIVRSVEASLIQWSLTFRFVKRSDRLSRIGQMADILETRFKTTVSAMIC